MVDDEFLLVPGSLLTLITGGLIPPLFHRVRNDRSIAVRQSLLYFVNPGLREETVPWIENEGNRGISVRTVALSCIGGR
jgi:isopenicillin N synthase-like dioxygenase